MIQTIKCPCGKPFAACTEPECYIDIDWQKEVRRYVKKGCTVTMADKQNFKFEKCECIGMKPKNKTAPELNFNPTP